MSVLFEVPIETLEPLLGREDPHLMALIEGTGEEPERDQGARSAGRLEAIMALLGQLPPRERDMFELYYVAKKRQEDIAYIMGVTQAAVSYCIGRACQRLRFMSESRLYLMGEDEINRLLATTELQPLDISILMEYRRTSQQSLTAANLGLTQGRVRHRLMRACAKLEQLAEERPELKELSRMFSHLRDNPNILLRVKLPQWANRGTQVVDRRFAGKSK